MESTNYDTIQFKLRWLDEDGHETGFLRKKGRFDGETLVLDDVQIPVSIVTHVETHESRVIVSAISEGGEIVHFALVVTKISPNDLKSALDIARSKSWAEHHKDELEKEGRGAAFRDEICPNCHATLILTDMPTTPQLYCHFCDVVSTVDAAEAPPPEERHLKICEECGMVSKPRKFTIFYFYFLLFVWGYQQRTTWRCPACMRPEAWKMLFGNLLFVIGVPVAIVQLCRSYGRAIGIGPFAGLDTANINAQKGKVMPALNGYRAILDRVPHSAGVKYNLGLALMKQNEIDRAAETFRLALDDCSNYAPAFHFLANCYQQLGETDELAELNRIWGVAPETADGQDETDGHAVL